MANLRIKFKKKDILDYIIIFMIILYVFILNWFNVQITSMIGILIVISWFLNFKSRITKTDFSIVWSLVFIFLYSVFNYVIKGGSITVFSENLSRVFLRLLIFVYFGLLLCYKSEFIKKFVMSLFPIFNIYAIINIPITILQFTGHYELAAYGMNLTNYMKEDMISGLFGLYGTPYMALYYSFLFIYNNYYISKNTHNRTSKYIILRIYNAVLLIYMTILSLTNDNKGFFIVFVIFNSVFYVLKLLNKTSKKSLIDRIVYILKKSIIVIIFAVVIFVVAYNFTALKEVIDAYLKIIELATRTKINAGSSERFHMILETLRNADMRWTGVGIGKYGWKQSGALGYLHFGQSDFGSCMCLGGLIFTVLIFYNVYIVLNKIFSDNLITIMLLLVFTFLMLFNAAITSTSMMVFYILFIIVCWMMLSDRTSSCNH